MKAARWPEGRSLPRGGVGRRPKKAAPRAGLVPFAAIAVAALLAACGTPGPRGAAVPALELPAAAAPLPPIATDWWKSFGDAQLDALVDEALRNNTDLARAVANIDASRAALRLAHANRLPTVNATASATRQRSSENGVLPLQEFGVSSVGNDFQGALGISYELDLWSRLRNTERGAREDLLSTAYAQETLRTALAAQVVQSYAALQAVDAQRTIYGRAVDAQRESLKLQRLRFDAGVLSELDIRQLEAELITNEAQLPKLDRARAEAERALALALGRTPRAIVEQGVARAPSPTGVGAAPALPADLPSDLLLHRPDVQAAEARLRAAGARVDAARAAYFPQLSLTGSLGLESVELENLFQRGSVIWSIVASLTQPIWDGGRLDAQTDATRAQQRLAELDYRDAVARAFKEVRDALGAYAEARTTLDSGERRRQALARAAQLTRLRFEGGESSLLDAIEADRAALNADAQNADARRALAAAQADVFRAMGGGWRVPDEPATVINASR